MPDSKPFTWQLEWYYFGDLVTVYTGSCDGKDVSAELSQYLGRFDASASHGEHPLVAFTRLVNGALGFNKWQREWPRDLRIRFRAGLEDAQLHPGRLVLPLPPGRPGGWTSELVARLEDAGALETAEDADEATLKQVNLFMDAADELLKPPASGPKPPFTKKEIEERMKGGGRVQRHADPLPATLDVRGTPDRSSHDYSYLAAGQGKLVADFGLRYVRKECPPGGVGGREEKARATSDYPCGNLCFTW